MSAMRDTSKEFYTIIGDRPLPGQGWWGGGE